jgi:NADH-quinone oxidoreductase subunit M
MQMIAHGLSTGGLFILVGMLQERTGTRDLDRLGGLWRRLPRLGGVGLVLAMASLGLPGLANFIGEFLVLLGAWRTDPVVTVISACGLVVAAIYALRLVQRTFHGPAQDDSPLSDLRPREVLIFAVALALLVALGLFPQPLIESARPFLERLVIAGATFGAAGG